MRLAIGTHSPPMFGRSTSSALPLPSTLPSVLGCSTTNDTRGSCARYAAHRECRRGMIQKEPSRHSCQQTVMYGLPSSLRHARYMLTPRERNSSTSSGVMPRTLPRHVSLLSDTGTSHHKRRRRIFIVAPSVSVDL